MNYWRNKIALMYDYQNIFSTPEGQRVLTDLRNFCKYDRTIADIDNVNLTYMREGSREVYLRILSFLNTNEAELTKLKEESEYDH